MNNYYLKVNTDIGYRYCAFQSHSLEQAIRNALFACFSYSFMEMYETSLNTMYPDVEDRYRVLNQLFGDKISVVDEQEFNLYEPKQDD